MYPNFFPFFSDLASRAVKRVVLFSRNMEVKLSPRPGPEIFQNFGEGDM